MENEKEASFYFVISRGENENQKEDQSRMEKEMDKVIEELRSKCENPSLEKISIFIKNE